MGYMKAHIPWLNANTWKLQRGMGITPAVLPDKEQLDEFTKTTNQQAQNRPKKRNFAQSKLNDVDEERLY